MIKPDSLTAFVLSALLLTPLLTISTGAFDLAASNGLNSLQTPGGVNARQILVKEQHRLLPSEKAKYSEALRHIQSGEELIREGQGMQSTRDHRSGLDGKIVSGARTRQAGAERVAEGRLLVRKAENNLIALARQVTERLGNAEEKMAGAQLRTWKDKDDRELRATFLRLNDDSVTVIREDRMEFTIPLATLSEEDVSYAFLASKGLTPDDSSFLKAIESSDVEVIDHIFKAGFQPSIPTQKLALEASIGKQSTSTLEAILSRGIDPNLLLDTGKPPLSHAVELSNLELINILLKFKASILTKDEHGLLPAHYGLSNPDQRILARVVPDKADIAESSHTVFEHILNSRLTSISREHLQLLVKHEAGKSMAPDQTAAVNLIIAAQKPTVSGYLEAMSKEDRHQFLPLYRDTGLAAEANATKWEKVLEIVKQSPGLSLEELLSVGGLSKQKEIQISLVSTGYDVTAESFEKAVAAADRKAVELFLLTDISPTEKTPSDESPLFRAFATQQAELADLIVTKAEVPSHEVARIRLLAEGDSLDASLRSKLKLEADEIPFTLEGFETAVDNADRQLVDLFITAGAIDEFNLDKDSAFWARTWSQTQGELKKHLLDSAFDDVKLRTQVAITHVDISAWNDITIKPTEETTVNTKYANDTAGVTSTSKETQQKNSTQTEKSQTRSSKQAVANENIELNNALEILAQGKNKILLKFRTSDDFPKTSSRIESYFSEVENKITEIYKEMAQKEKQLIAAEDLNHLKLISGSKSTFYVERVLENKDFGIPDYFRVYQIRPAPRSNDLAILKTQFTIYESEGYATLNIITEENMQVKMENGFTRAVDVYRETDPSYSDMISNHYLTEREVEQLRKDASKTLSDAARHAEARWGLSF